MADEKLVAFVKDALKGGYTEEYLRKGLIAQGWPPTEIDGVFNSLKTTTQTQEHILQPIIQKQEELTSKPNSKQSPKKIFIYFGVGTAVFLVILLTLSIFNLVMGMTKYEINDPGTGKNITGYCLAEDQRCIFRNQFALDYTKERLFSAFIISLITALVIIVTYLFIPQKKTFLWIVNGIYFLFIVFIFIRWLLFILPKQ